jgi:hypothetical protein
MWKDATIPEIYQIREAHSNQFNNESEAIYQDLK